jgi:adenylate cyclase
MSIVHYVDSDRVGLSRQFFNKTRANLDANPRGQLRVVDPGTYHEYLLDLEYLHTETHGPIFDAMNVNNEALAAQAGMSGVFRLRGVDIHRVLRCAHVEGTGIARAPTADRNVLGQLDGLTRRLALCTDYGEATRTALQALDDLFGFRQSILLVREPDDSRERLLAVAGNGYPTPAEGAELPLGKGAVGVAADTRPVVTVPHVGRSRIMQTAVATDAAGADTMVPLPVFPARRALPRCRCSSRANAPASSTWRARSRGPSAPRTSGSCESSAPTLRASCAPSTRGPAAKRPSRA